MLRYLPWLLAVVAIPSTATAGVHNGGFESGGQSWEHSEGWAFLADGGRPNGHALLTGSRGGWLRQTFDLDAGSNTSLVLRFDYKFEMFDGDPEDGHSAFPVMSAGLAGELVQPFDGIEGAWQSHGFPVTAGEHTFVFSVIAVYGTMTLDVDNVRIETSVPTHATSWGELKVQYE